MTRCHTLEKGRYPVLERLGSNEKLTAAKDLLSGCRFQLKSRSVSWASEPPVSVSCNFDILVPAISCHLEKWLYRDVRAQPPTCTGNWSLELVPIVWNLV